MALLQSVYNTIYYILCIDGVIIIINLLFVDSPSDRMDLVETSLAPSQQLESQITKMVIGING